MAHHFFAPNIGLKGRLARGITGLLLLGGAIFTHGQWGWVSYLLACGGLFCMFQAFRGWCLARACGIKTIM